LLIIPELDPNLPETHVVLKEDDVISASEARWFRKQLERIAGKNRFNKPNLQMVWGPTYTDPMEVDRQIKYQDFTDGFGRVFGERRFFIEMWRSPEFLKRSGRYKVINDPDTVTEFYFCKACETEIKCSREALEQLGSVPPCPQCGSNRSRTELIREPGKGQLLCEFPREGCYDYWFRVERANLTYHAPDQEVLAFVKERWKFEQMSQTERDALQQADDELNRRQVITLMRQSGAVYTGAVPFNQIPRL
jgi:hypothetical protein